MAQIGRNLPPSTESNGVLSLHSILCQNNPIYSFLPYFPIQFLRILHPFFFRIQNFLPNFCIIFPPPYVCYMLCQSRPPLHCQNNILKCTIRNVTQPCIPSYVLNTKYSHWQHDLSHTNNDYMGWDVHFIRQFLFCCGRVCLLLFTIILAISCETPRNCIIRNHHTLDWNIPCTAIRISSHNGDPLVMFCLIF